MTPPNDLALLSPDELALLDRVKTSVLWQLIVEGLRAEREELLSRAATSTEELWARWGAIATLTRWMECGPFLVIAHRRQATHTPTQPTDLPVDR